MLQAAIMTGVAAVDSGGPGASLGMWHLLYKAKKKGLQVAPPGLPAAVEDSFLPPVCFILVTL